MHALPVNHLLFLYEQMTNFHGTPSNIGDIEATLLACHFIFTFHIKFMHVDLPELYYRFTQKNILRVYPKGTRFNSSNYNPLLGWMHGAQMVAFNMQVLLLYA